MQWLWVFRGHLKEKKSVCVCVCVCVCLCVYSCKCIDIGILAPNYEGNYPIKMSKYLMRCLYSNVNRKCSMINQSTPESFDC